MRGAATVARRASSPAPEPSVRRARVRGTFAIAMVCAIAAAMAFRHLGTKPL